MCIRDSLTPVLYERPRLEPGAADMARLLDSITEYNPLYYPVSYTHLRAHETVLDLVCRLLLDKKNKQTKKTQKKTNNTQNTHEINSLSRTMHMTTLKQ